MTGTDLINNFQKFFLVPGSQPPDGVDIAVANCKLDF